MKQSFLQKKCQSVLNKKYKINGRPQSFVNYIQLFGVELQKGRKQQPYKVRKKRSKKPGLSTVMEFGGRSKSPGGDDPKVELLVDVSLDTIVPDVSPNVKGLDASVPDVSPDVDDRKRKKTPLSNLKGRF